MVYLRLIEKLNKDLHTVLVVYIGSSKLTLKYKQMDGITTEQWDCLLKLFEESNVWIRFWEVLNVAFWFNRIFTWDLIRLYDSVSEYTTSLCSSPHCHYVGTFQQPKLL